MSYYGLAIWLVTMVVYMHFYFYLVACCISDGCCSVCSYVADSINFCGKTKGFLKDVIPFCNGDMWPDLLFDIIQVVLMSISILVICCCRPSYRSDREAFICAGIIMTCIVVFIDIIKIGISFALDDTDVAVFELIMFVITLAISCCLHCCTCEFDQPCIPGVLILAVLQVTGEVVKHMYVVHYDKKMDGTGCLLF